MAKNTKGRKQRARVLLAEKQEALLAAQADREAAHERYDENGVAAAEQRIGTLRDFIDRLQSEAEGEREAEGRTAAERWIAEQQPDRRDVAKRIEAAQEVVRAKLVDLLAAISKEAELRQSAWWNGQGIELLAARFGLSNRDASAAVPPVKDWAMDVIAAVGAMSPRRAKRFRPGGHRASAGPEEIQRGVLATVSKFAKTHRASLPPEVLDILDSAPIPDFRSPQQRERETEREQRARSAQQRTLDSIKGMEKEMTMRSRLPDPGPLRGGM